MADLHPGPPPPQLVPDPLRERRRKLEEAVTRVADRFGSRGLTRATLLEPAD